MSMFIQLHYLTVYPPSNPNRDDQGRPKTAIFGGQPRLRISSQSLKRAARISDVMQQSLTGNLGERTQRIGDVILSALKAEGADKAAALEIAKKIADVFGKIDAQAEKEGNIRIRQLAFVSPQEREIAIDLAKKAMNGDPLPDNKSLKKMVLRTADGAADIAMFGRMLADDPDFNREAAVQVSHAITTHRVMIEDDFYTAVDDLKTSAEDAGAGFVGDAGFGSGVYYLYACIDVGLLIENLDGCRSLAARTVETFTEAMAVATPSGKRNSYAHQTRAGFIRAEKGAQQPRSLAGAFFEPVRGSLMSNSIIALTDMANKMDHAYGPCADDHMDMDVENGLNNLAGIKEFTRKAVSDD